MLAVSTLAFATKKLSSRGLTPGPIGVDAVQSSTGLAHLSTATRVERAMGPGIKCRDDTMRVARAP
jgi:hypothetical protein